MKWENGRQSTEGQPPYKVMHLLPTWLCSRLCMDIALVKYEKGSSIPLHVDNDLWWSGYDTTRTNIVLKDAIEGGHFQISGVANNPDKLWKKGKFFGLKTVTFRPDIMPHRVTKVKRGSRLVLSIGRFKKTDRANVAEGSFNGKLWSERNIQTAYTLMSYYVSEYMQHKQKVAGLVFPCTGNWGYFTQDLDIVGVLAKMRQTLYGHSGEHSRYVVETTLGQY
jgi:hypothetical protein